MPGEYTIVFSADDLQVVLNALMEHPMPWKVSQPILVRINGQITAQTTPQISEEQPEVEKVKANRRIANKG
jgi:hypothetical protein